MEPGRQCWGHLSVLRTVDWNWLKLTHLFRRHESFFPISFGSELLSIEHWASEQADERSGAREQSKHCKSSKIVRSVIKLSTRLHFSSLRESVSHHHAQFGTTVYPLTRGKSNPNWVLADFFNSHQRQLGGLPHEKKIWWGCIGSRIKRHFLPTIALHWWTIIEDLVLSDAAKKKRQISMKIMKLLTRPNTRHKMRLAGVWEKSLRTYGRTDGPTDGRTEGQTLL